MSDSLGPHGLQHASLPYPSPSPGVCSNPCPLSRWCYPTISSSVAPFSSCLLCSIRVFSNKSALHIRWPKYWSFSFSISPSNEHSWLISFQFSSVQFSRSVVSNSLRPHESQHARPPCPSPTLRAHSDSHPSSQWCHPAIPILCCL